jgi:hypothetical protein
MSEEKLSRLERYKKMAGETRPWDILNPSTEYVDSKISDERYSICLSCPELINLTKQCKKCGCFMALKTKIEKASCPIGKW